MQEGKWYLLSEEAFTNSWEVEGKGERERYAMSAEF